MTNTAASTNTIPNFDAMTESELMSFWVKHRQGSSFKASAALIGDRRKGYTVLAGDLAAYACNKSVAMRARTAGDMQLAESYEKACDQIYSNLPADLKW